MATRMINTSTEKNVGHRALKAGEIAGGKQSSEGRLMWSKLSNVSSLGFFGQNVKFVGFLLNTQDMIGVFLLVSKLC